MGSTPPSRGAHGRAQEIVIRVVIEMPGGGSDSLKLAGFRGDEGPFHFTAAQNCGRRGPDMPQENAALRLTSADDNAPTLPVIVAKWKAELMRMRRSPAYQKQGPKWVNALAAEYGWQHPGDATTDQIQTWLGKQTAWTGHTQNNVLSQLSTFFNFAFRAIKLRRENPCDPIPRVVEETGQGSRAFTSDEVARIIHAARGHWKTACILMATTALRRGAVFKARGSAPQKAVTCSMFDAAGRTLDIPPGILKNKKPLRIPLNDDAYAMLAEATRGREPDALIVPVCFDEDVWLALLKRAGVPHRDARGQVAGTHSFRKAVATSLAAAGVHPTIAQELLGHSDIRQTMGVYTRLNDTHRAEAVKNLRIAKPENKGTYALVDQKNEAGDKISLDIEPGMPKMYPVAPVSIHPGSFAPRTLPPLVPHISKRCAGQTSLDGHESQSVSGDPLSGKALDFRPQTPRLGLESSRGTAESGPEGTPTGMRGTLTEAADGSPSERSQLSHPVPHPLRGEPRPADGDGRAVVGDLRRVVPGCDGAAGNVGPLDRAGPSPEPRGSVAAHPAPAIVGGHGFAGTPRLTPPSTAGAFFVTTHPALSALRGGNGSPESEVRHDQVSHNGGFTPAPSSLPAGYSHELAAPHGERQSADGVPFNTHAASTTDRGPAGAGDGEHPDGSFAHVARFIDAHPNRLALIRALLGAFVLGALTFAAAAASHEPAPVAIAAPDSRGMP